MSSQAHSRAFLITPLDAEEWKVSTEVGFTLTHEDLMHLLGVYYKEALRVVWDLFTTGGSGSGMNPFRRTEDVENAMRKCGWKNCQVKGHPPQDVEPIITRVKEDVEREFKDGRDYKGVDLWESRDARAVDVFLRWFHGEDFGSYAAAREAAGLPPGWWGDGEEAIPGTDDYLAKEALAARLHAQENARRS